jgi:hypothetical protein
MNTKHTPGPWINNGRIGPSDSRLLISANPHRPHKDVGREIAITSHEDPDIELANARLIAAAPDLLAALEEMAKDYLIQNNFHEDRNTAAARAAIAKAT